MFDRYSRRIEYLRVAVTDRCNLRCTYCMPSEGVSFKHHDQILRYEQIEAVVRAATELGVRKVRLTGGEPLLRKGIEDLVAMLSPLPGLEKLCMTTNGTRLAALAPKLKAAGLNQVNISIDSLDPGKYAAITRGGDLAEALAGVDAALANKLTPVKINMVVFADTAQSEINDMRAFCEAKGVTLQLINHFTLDRRDHTAQVVPADRPPKCAACNRLRLTADGYLKPQTLPVFGKRDPREFRRHPRITAGCGRRKAAQRHALSQPAHARYRRITHVIDSSGQFRRRTDGGCIRQTTTQTNSESDGQDRTGT